MLQGMTVSHCPGLTTLWTQWLEPKGIPLWTLKSSYWQVDLHPDDKKTAFLTGQGAVHSHALWSGRIRMSQVHPLGKEEMAVSL
jgi:hypothetical protein